MRPPNTLWIRHAGEYTFERMMCKAHLMKGAYLHVILQHFASRVVSFQTLVQLGNGVSHGVEAC